MPYLGHEVAVLVVQVLHVLVNGQALLVQHVGHFREDCARADAVLASNYWLKCCSYAFRPK